MGFLVHAEKVRIICLRIMKLRTIIPLIITATLTFTACEKKVDLIPKSDILSYPSVSVRDFETVYTDSGRIQLILTSPLMEQYDTKDSSFTEFRMGIRVDYYDGDTVPHGLVTSKYAKYLKGSDTWKLRDSVVVINENKDMLETELLNWDQKKDFIYTDRFVKITSHDPDMIVLGMGFESDSHLNHRKIMKVSAEIYVDEQDSVQQ